LFSKDDTEWAQLSQEANAKESSLRKRKKGPKRAKAHDAPEHAHHNFKQPPNTHKHQLPVFRWHFSTPPLLRSNLVNLVKKAFPSRLYHFAKFPYFYR
jgi:hypothetical protein